MTDPKTLAALIAVALATSGCDLADRLEGKSPNREYIERREANEAQYAAPIVSPPAALLAVAPEPEPLLDPVAVPEPIPVVQDCLPQFLVRRCGPDGAEPW